MAESSSGAVTRILKSAESDPRTAEKLLPLIYAELRTLARALMAKTPPGNTLQATALVHEAYLRLVGKEDPGWDGRGHFFAAAAEAMRRILVEQARRKARLKHGGGYQRHDLKEGDLTIEPPSDDILALDEALDRLQRRDPRKAKVVMLRHFAGLTIPETAKMLGLSEPTVKRDWSFARALLLRQINESESSS